MDNKVIFFVFIQTISWLPQTGAPGAALWEENSEINDGMLFEQV